jgi:hypothetical protein
MTDELNLATRGRHGAAWRELGIDEEADAVADALIRRRLPRGADSAPMTAPEPSPYDGLRTQWLIVALAAAIVTWVVAAVLRG